MWTKISKYIRGNLATCTFPVHYTFIEFVMEIAQGPPRKLYKIDKLEKRYKNLQKESRCVSLCAMQYPMRL